MNPNSTLRRIALAALLAGLVVGAAPADAQAKKTRRPARKPSAVSHAPLPKLDQLSARFVKLQRGHLLVGLNDGGIGLCDPASGKTVNVVKGAGGKPTRDAAWEGGQMWWIREGDDRLWSASRSQRTATSIDLAKAGMSQAPRRLSVWQGRILVHGDSEVRAIDPVTKQVSGIDSVLPTDIARIARQGTILSNWTTTREGMGRGQLIVVRRYGRKNKEVPGHRADIAAFTGWFSDGPNNYRLLGTYTKPLVEFRTGSGEKPVFRFGDKTVISEFGACDPANIALGPEGLVALDAESLCMVPFRRTSWLPDDIAVRHAPNYSSVMSYWGSSVWWADGTKLTCASIEDGSTDTIEISTKDRAKIDSIAADDQGAWICAGGAISRIEATAFTLNRTVAVKMPTDVDPFASSTAAPTLGARAFPVGIGKPNPSIGTDLFVQVNVGGDYDKPWLPEHQRLLEVAQSWLGTPYVWGGNDKSGCDCSGFVRGVFMEMGINLPRHSQDMGQASIGEIVTGDLRFGDVLVFPSPKHVALYVGGGKTIEAVSGGVGYSTIWRRSQAVVRRFITQ